MILLHTGRIKQTFTYRDSMQGSIRQVAVGPNLLHDYSQLNKDVLSVSVSL
jgi:hypothetical protein